jgi:hypothetical protein
MGSPVMTYQLAMAASFDAAERRRRQAGRTSWNAADRACAAEAFKRCIPLMPPHERVRYDVKTETFGTLFRLGNKRNLSPGRPAKKTSSSVYCKLDLH